MADIQRSPGNRPSRRQREQRAYRLTMATGAFGIVAVVGLVLAAVGVLGFGVPVIAAIVAGICYLMLRRSLGM
jgi:hypothetical protein